MTMKQSPAGMYLHSNSKLHRMNAQIKLLLLLLFLVCTLISRSPVSFALLLTCLLIGVKISELPARQIFGAVIHLRWFFLFIFIMNVFFYDGGRSGGMIALSWNGVGQAIRVVMMTAFVLMAGSLYTSTTPPIRIVHSMQWILSPLRHVRVPIRQIALIFSAAMQFIPILYEEADRIKKAQIARGAGWEQRGLIRRAMGILSLVLPVFVVAFRRADELALAMESRGYMAGDSSGSFVRAGFSRRNLTVVFSGFAVLGFILCLELLWKKIVVI